MRISYTKFLTKLSAVDEKFGLSLIGEIRSGRSNQCPWLAVSDGKTLSVMLNKDEVSHAIWRAADNHGGHNKKIRKDLLLACRLEAQ